jgi:predicted ATPase/DNA-binding SARP family transcriptional activator
VAIAFRLLGRLEVPLEDRASGLGGPKQRLLLALLLLKANEVVSREEAVDCLWEDDPPGRPEAVLQVYVHHLRGIVGRERIITHGTGYLLRADPDEIDAAVFERGLSEARAALAAGDDRRSSQLIENALELWQGEALADLPYGSFVGAERDRLADLRHVAEELRFEARLALGEHSELIPELELFVGRHPFRERVWGQLMLALYRAGRQADALDVYRRVREQLSDQLGIEPDPQLRELERAILRQDPSLGVRPASRSGSRSPLPRPATPLVGRALEIAGVSAMLETGEARFVTLVGPGGVGKTRLAIAVAQELEASMADGSVFVGLAPLTDASLVPSALATALGLGEGSIETLIPNLASRELLVVLDNFEQIVDAGPLITQLVAAAPRLRILVTSRTRLDLSGERLYSVPPFETPRADLRFEDLGRNHAVAVFLARARALDQSFRLTEENAPLIAEICRLLEGLPLAIELAAARSKLLSPLQLLERIVRPLELLTGGHRDSPTRHQTLRAAIDWSYELLEPAQRTLFARLSVLAGSCTLEAIDAVCATDLDSLAGLLDQSLVRREQEPGREPRFRMLATVREYAAERLDDDDRAVVRRRHALYFLKTAEQARETIAGSGEREAELLASIEQDHDNYRAALRWAQEVGDSGTMLRLVTALRLFWMVRGYLAEGRSWFEAALTAPGASDDTNRAHALSAAGTLVYRAGEYELARRWWEEARDRFERAGDASNSARTLGHLAGIALVEGDLDRAIELWEQSALELRTLGEEMRLAIALGNLGFAMSSRHRYEQAIEYLNEALLLSQRAHNWITECAVLFNLGRATFELGDVEHGRRLLQDALRIADGLRYHELVATCLLGLADIASEQGDDGRARQLLGACDHLTTTHGIRFQADELALHERVVSRLGAEPAADPNVEEAVAAALA